MSETKFSNPFKPGAGHMPPYLAGREDESKEFRKLLQQETILDNLVLTGLRGLGKTVLLETLKPMAIESGWLWAGTDLSESMSISEDNLALRIITDVSVATASLVLGVHERQAVGLGGAAERTEIKLTFGTLKQIYDRTPGLVADKLKGVLEVVWKCVDKAGKHGMIFAYDEAQNLADHAGEGQFPLSLLLDVFQSIQRKNIRFMLALVGLPTLFPKLVEARTFAERMFRVVVLNPLSKPDTVKAIRVPIDRSDDCPVKFADQSVDVVWNITRGYPYFVQYVCREVFDVWVQSISVGRRPPVIPVVEITRKLDSDFFSGRWARATDRQRELLAVIARLPNCDSEFTVQEITESEMNRVSGHAFSGSHVNQMLASFSDAGLIYKNRHGKYSFAVPMMGDFIRRQTEALMADTPRPSNRPTTSGG